MQTCFELIRYPMEKPKDVAAVIIKYVFLIYFCALFSNVNAATCRTCYTPDKPCPRCYPTHLIKQIHPCRYGNGCPKVCVVNYWSNRIRCVHQCYKDLITE